MKTPDLNRLPRKFFMALCLGTALVFAFGYWLGTKNTDSLSLSGAQPLQAGLTIPAEAPHEAHIYICPMSCVPPMEQPGNCPVCGMELMQAEGAEESARLSSSLYIDDAAAAAAGIRTAPVERKFVTAEVRLFGRIEYDPVEQYKVTAYAPGVIDRIYVKRAGQTVRAGDPLFDIHCPELFFIEQELFELLKAFPDDLDYRPALGQRYRRLMRQPTRSLSARNPDGEIDEEKKEALEKLEQIKRKMRLLGLSAKDIDNVMARGRPTGISTVITPTTGVVQEQYAFKGSYVNTGEVIFTVANPKYMWAKFEAYESDFPWIRLGQEAAFEVDAFPGEKFAGKVLFVDTEFDPRTRTFTVGVLHTDSSARLKPNMLARAVIEARMTAGGVSVPGGRIEDEPPLVVPDSAPLVTGKRAIVYISDPVHAGHFHAREVVLGARAKGYYVIKQGLREGDLVVVNGNFKIDSAVQILARSSMMEPNGEAPAAPDVNQAAETASVRND